MDIPFAMVGGNFLTYLMWGFGAILCLGIIGSIVWFVWWRKQWFIKVEFKLPRGVNYLKKGEEIDVESINGYVSAEQGRGRYDASRGVVWVKRSWRDRKVAIKPMDVKKFLQGGNILTVVQVGVRKYVPIMPESFLKLEDKDTGEEALLVKHSCEEIADETWGRQWERDCKSTFTISNLLREYAPYIGLAMILFFNFVGFAILWGKVK